MASFYSEVSFFLTSRSDCFKNDLFLGTYEFISLLISLSKQLSKLAENRTPRFSSFLLTNCEYVRVGISSYRAVVDCLNLLSPCEELNPLTSDSPSADTNIAVSRSFFSAEVFKADKFILGVVIFEVLPMDSRPTGGRLKLFT